MHCAKSCRFKIEYLVVMVMAGIRVPDRVWHADDFTETVCMQADQDFQDILTATCIAYRYASDTS